MSANDSALEVIRLLSEAEDYSELGCPDCHGRLVVHQPDERLPERLLGTCRSCLAWFLIDAAGGAVLRLPDEVTLRNAGALSRTGHLGRFAVGPSGPHRLDGPEELPKDRRRRRRTSGRMEQSPPRD